MGDYVFFSVRRQKVEEGVEGMRQCHGEGTTPGRPSKGVEPDSTQGIHAIDKEIPENASHERSFQRLWYKIH